MLNELMYHLMRNVDKTFELLNKCSLSTSHSWVPVAHACNPSYSGGRDQEDQSSKPTPPNNL
jgi:hypothetical protein